MPLTDLPTPQVLVDRTRLRGNIDRMQAAADARGVRLRPHAKTHKSPTVAAWQIERGAIGICCAKVGEAEVFAEAGVEDIRLPYPVSPFNANRVLALQRRARISIIVDHPTVAAAWSRAMEDAGSTLEILVKVDVGFHRCGIDPDGSPALEFIEWIATLPGLRLLGLLSHAGQSYLAESDDELVAIAQSERECLCGLADRAIRRGVALPEISVGSTPTARFSLDQPGITEVRPGNYVYCDRTQVGLGSSTLDECALTVMATVVSKPSAERLVLDSGSKTLSSDRARGVGQTDGYGLVFPDLQTNAPDESLVVERLSEEHAVVRVDGGPTALEPGDRVRLLPNHACVVSNLVNHIQLVDGLDVIETLPVAARGRIS